MQSGISSLRGKWPLAEIFVRIREGQIEKYHDCVQSVVPTVATAAFPLVLEVPLEGTRE
jgi:hypothetical protein